MPIWRTVCHARVRIAQSPLAGLQRSYVRITHDDDSPPERRRKPGPRGVRQDDVRKSGSRGAMSTKQTYDITTHTWRPDRPRPRPRASENTALPRVGRTPPYPEEALYDEEDEEVDSVAEALLGDSIDWTPEPRKDMRKEISEAPATASITTPHVEESRSARPSSLAQMKEENLVLLERIALLEKLALLENRSMGSGKERLETVAKAPPPVVGLGVERTSASFAGDEETLPKTESNGGGRSSLGSDDVEDEPQTHACDSMKVARRRDAWSTARDEQGGRQRVPRTDRPSSRNASMNTTALDRGSGAITRDGGSIASLERTAAKDTSTDEASDVCGTSSPAIDVDDIESRHGGYYHRRGQGLRDLPLPPMLRPAPKLKDRFRNLDFKGVYRPPRLGGPTMADNLKNAPFSTAFAMNPYARALATGNRECCFTGIRLPLSCFLEFHLADSPDGKGVSLLPLSLVASLVPKNKSERSRTPDERKVIEQVEAAQGDPKGVASYITAQRAAVLFISESKNRARDYAVTRRLKISMGSDHALRSVTWREDMDDVILNNMRQIVVRRLRYHFDTKEVSDNPGLFAAPPGDGHDLNRLQEMDNVMCVLCLKEPETIHEDVQDDAQKDNEEPESPVGTQKNGLRGRTIGFLDEQELNRLLANESKVFLRGVQALPPPEVPSKTYYPTFRYRNRRVAVYSLTNLLGTDRLAELVQGTAFRNSSFVAVVQALGAVDLQLWLLKLQSYLGKTKRETVKM